MTNEQWLVYLWSIYPNGGFQVFWVISLVLVVGLLTLAAASYFSDTGGYRYSEEEKNTYLWRKLGKWKIIMPSVLLLFIFLLNLVPNREHFAYIIATPYVVESGKSIVDSLNDPNSKLSKLNQMTDKALDKALMYLDEDKNDKQNKN
jgi:phosphatidylglycerophosphate synthase